MNEIPPFYKLGPNGVFNSYRKSKEGEEFYLSLKKSFKNGRIIEFNSKDNTWPNHYDKYIKRLITDLKKEYDTHQDLNVFHKQYELIKKHYDIGLRWDFYYYFVDFLISIKEYEKALIEWNTLRKEEWGSSNPGTYRDNEVSMLMEFEKLLNKRVIDARNIYHIASKGNQLTNFGINNRKEVYELLTKKLMSENSSSFFEAFYEKYNLKSQKRITYPIEYYRKFFNHSEKYLTHFKRFEKDNFKDVKLKNGNATQSFVFLAISSEASRLLRDSENEYRLLIGANKIGEGWISETELYYKIKKHFKQYNVVHHGKPKWLGRQHFDIWIPELNIAIEYQGMQHQKPIEYFGGEIAFKKGQERDARKKRLCHENNCLLFYVYPNEDMDEFIKKLKKIIKKLNEKK